jgi:hypothetical protein
LHDVGVVVIVLRTVSVVAVILRGTGIATVAVVSALRAIGAVIVFVLHAIGVAAVIALRAIGVILAASRSVRVAVATLRDVRADASVLREGVPITATRAAVGCLPGTTSAATVSADGMSAAAVMSRRTDGVSVCMVLPSDTPMVMLLLVVAAMLAFVVVERQGYLQIEREVALNRRLV